MRETKGRVSNDPVFFIWRLTRLPCPARGLLPQGDFQEVASGGAEPGARRGCIAAVLSVTQEFLEARAKLRAIFGLAVPNNQNLPSKFLERCNMLSVARDVAFEFQRPVAGIRFGLPRIEAACLGV